MDIEKIQNKLREFSKERDWEQFHSPKNLSMALSVEVAELVEIFQWSQSGGMDEIANQKTRKEIEKEIADIFIYTLKIADLLNMDLEKVALEKIEENAKKYPIESSKGKAIKYDQL